MATDYTSKDFASIRRKLAALVASKFADWNDRDRANFGNVILDAFSHVGDGIAYYQDAQAAEAFITRVTQRKNALAHARRLAYTPSGCVAATSVVTFTIGAATAGDVVFAAGTFVKTPEVTNAVALQLLAAATIAAGQTSVTGTVENSVNREQRVTSTGLPDQEVRLGNTPFLDGSLSVTAGNGSYTVVDNLLDSTSADRHCTVVVDQNDAATVTFGDGSLGAIPTGTIVLTYKTWGGHVGSLAAGTISRIEGTFTDSLGNAVTVTVTNAADSTEGSDRESIARMRVIAPLESRSHQVAVARDDYETGAMEVAGVARALHLTKTEMDSVGENEGFLYVVPSDTGTASSTLRAQVTGQFYVSTAYPDPPYKAMQTYQLHVVTAIYKTVDIRVVLYKRKGYTASQVKASVTEALTTMFAPMLDEDGVPTESTAAGIPNPLINFGFYLQDVDGNPTNILSRSTIFDTVLGAAGVLRIGAGYVDFLLNDLETGDVDLETYEFPKLGTVTLVDGDTGLTM